MHIGVKGVLETIPWLQSLFEYGNTQGEQYKAYHSVPRAALGLSDHCLVHLIPSYRQKLKSAKPVLKSVKRWTNETERDLQACFDLTDWTVFEAAATDLDELRDCNILYQFL